MYLVCKMCYVYIVLRIWGFGFGPWMGRAREWGSRPMSLFGPDKRIYGLGKFCNYRESVGHFLNSLPYKIKSTGSPSPVLTPASAPTFIFFSTNPLQNTHFNDSFPFTKFKAFFLDLDSSRHPLSNNIPFPPFYSKTLKYPDLHLVFVSLRSAAPKLTCLIVSLLLQTAFNSMLVYPIFENCF